MGWAGRLPLAAVGVLIAAGAGAQNLRRATVTVADHLGSEQQEETITVYLGGVLAGTLHVDAAHPDDSFVATVPAADRLPYTLCGKLVKRAADGAISTHPIDNGGVLSSYADAKLDAITLGDVLFTFTDAAGRADVTVQNGPACTAAVS